MNMNDELDMLLNNTKNLTDEELITEYEREYKSNIEILKFKEKELANNFSNGLNEEIKKLKQRQEYLINEIERLKFKVNQKNERIRKFKELHEAKEPVNKNIEPKNDNKNIEPKNDNNNIELKITDEKLHNAVEKRKDKIRQLEIRKKNLEEIEESLSKTVELPKIDPDEEITVELPKKTVEEIKEKSKNEQVVESKAVSDIKIIYTAKNGIYTINALVNNEYKTATCLISKDLINSNSEKDTNFIPLFEIFDKENNTNLKQKFSDDKLEYTAIYDLRGASSLHRSILRSKDKKEQKKFAKKQSLEKANVDYISNFSKKKAAILLGTTLVGSAALYGIGKNMSFDNGNKEVIEATTEKSTDDLDLYNNEKITTFETKQTTEEIEKNDEKDFIITDYGEDKSVEEEPDFVDYKIGDIVDLENVDLYYASDSDEIISNTEDPVFKDCENYQLTMMSVVRNGKSVKSYVKNASLRQLKEEYKKIFGDDNFEIRINATGLDKEHNMVLRNIGWFDDDNLEDEYQNVKTK